MADLVTFGEAMLRLSPPGNERLELASTLEFRAAGAESNVAAAAQRLGIESLWLSKLPDSPLGRKVRGALERHGMDTEIVWSDSGRQGAYYLEQAGAPRGTNIEYDRANAAVTTATPDELATEEIATADAFYTCGITAALSETLAATTADLLEFANREGTTTVFDVNYRSKLWSHEEARTQCEALFPDVDVLLTAARDARAVLGLEGAAEELAAELAERWGFDTVVVTRGEAGSLTLHDGELIETGVYEADTHDPIGTGDAFLGAFLAAWLQGNSVEDALEYGSAAAALKRTIPGDVATVTPEEVEAVIEAPATEISR